MDASVAWRVLEPTGTQAPHAPHLRMTEPPHAPDTPTAAHPLGDEHVALIVERLTALARRVRIRVLDQLRTGSPRSPR